MESNNCINIKNVLQVVNSFLELKGFVENDFSKILMAIGDLHFEAAACDLKDSILEKNPREGINRCLTNLRTAQVAYKKGWTQISLNNTNRMMNLEMFLLTSCYMVICHAYLKNNENVEKLLSEMKKEVDHYKSNKAGDLLITFIGIFNPLTWVSALMSLPKGMKIDDLLGENDFIEGSGLEIFSSQVRRNLL
jgi:hypothetical protein